MSPAPVDRGGRVLSDICAIRLGTPLIERFPSLTRCLHPCPPPSALVCRPSIGLRRREVCPSILNPMPRPVCRRADTTDGFLPTPARRQSTPARRQSAPARRQSLVGSRQSAVGTGRRERETPRRRSVTLGGRGGTDGQSDPGRDRGYQTGVSAAGAGRRATRPVTEMVVGTGPPPRVVGSASGPETGWSRLSPGCSGPAA
jgi:hypothetical protein